MAPPVILVLINSLDGTKENFWNFSVFYIWKLWNSKSTYESEIWDPNPKFKTQSEIQNPNPKSKIQNMKPEIWNSKFA